MINKYSKLEYAAIYASLFLFIGFLMLPFIEAFLVSMRPMSEVFNVPYRFITDNMSFDAYVSMWKSQPLLGRSIFNSFFIAGTVTVFSLICIVPAAYAFSRLRFKGNKTLYIIFLSINMVGPAVLIVPLYKVMFGLGMLNTYWAMILPGTAFAIPIGVLLMKTYFDVVPRELEEAAYVDGASRFYTMRRVIIPIAAPGMVVVAVNSFIAGYAQQFLFALTFNSISEIDPLPKSLFAYFGRENVVWNELMAAAITGILPVLLVYVFLQRYIVSGLTAGAVK